MMAIIATTFLKNKGLLQNYANNHKLNVNYCSDTKLAIDDKKIHLFIYHIAGNFRGWSIFTILQV